ncbi:MAG: Clp protease N-terminal domain-containing protein [Streptosporangiaceae bacterium]
MASREPDPEPYLAAIRRGFQFARELGCRCGTVHLLVGISEGHDQAAALGLRQGRSLRDAVTEAGDAFGDGAGYLHMQAQGAARSLARQLGQPLHPGHLLTALLDQGTPDVLRALTLAGLDPAAVRRAALAAVGAPAGLPPAAMPPLAPAGSLGRPALPVAELDERAWAALRWRQDHLPLSKLRHHQDWAALGNLERAAARRIADELELDDDQRFSLISHHDTEVARRAAQARPDLAPRPRKQPAWHRHPWLHGLPAGWAAWLGNRWVSVRDRWFRLRTLRSYRQAPQP